MKSKNIGKWVVGMLAVAVLAVPGVVAAREARVAAAEPANASHPAERAPSVQELIAPPPQGCARVRCQKDVNCDNICPGLPAFCDTETHFCVLE